MRAIYNFAVNGHFCQLMHGIKRKMCVMGQRRIGGECIDVCCTYRCIRGLDFLILYIFNNDGIRANLTLLNFNTL